MDRAGSAPNNFCERAGSSGLLKGTGPVSPAFLLWINGGPINAVPRLPLPYRPDGFDQHRGARVALAHLAGAATETGHPGERASAAESRRSERRTKSCLSEKNRDGRTGGSNATAGRAGAASASATSDEAATRNDRYGAARGESDAVARRADNACRGSANIRRATGILGVQQPLRHPGLRQHLQILSGVGLHLSAV